jgi:hypothetical protein
VEKEREDRIMRKDGIKRVTSREILCGCGTEVLNAFVMFPPSFVG